MENVILDLEKKYVPALKKFIERQFHSKYILLNDAFFDWQYKKDGRYTMKIIYHNGEVWGYCGFIPVSMKMGEKNVDGACFANLMVDERARGFGGGARLIQSISELFPLCYINGYTAASEEIYRKLGRWMPMGNLNRYIKILNPKKAGFLAENFNFDLVPEKATQEKNFKFEKINLFDKKVNYFWEKVKTKYPLTIERSAEYLNGRYAMHPFLKYEMYVEEEHGAVSGFLISRVEVVEENGITFKIGRIIDFVSLNESEEKIINYFSNEMQNKNIDLIDFFFSGNFYTRSLFNQGFFAGNKPGYENIPILFNPISRKKKHINFIAYFKDGANTKNLLTDPNNWYITKGDGDQDRPNFV